MQIMDLSMERSESANVSYILASDDILTAILIRLPIRSLLRFMSVSKHWRSLITNPHFSRLRNPNPGPPSGLFLISSPIKHELDFVPFNDEAPIKPAFRRLTFAGGSSGVVVVHSCNGLICCRENKFSVEEPNGNYYIYNPTTQKFATLPLPGGGFYALNLAFDPSKSPLYKVVCVRRSGTNYQIEIYSSDTGIWKVSGEPFSAHLSTNFQAGVYWNGAIHWISREGSSLYFNVDRELLKTLPMPPIPKHLYTRKFLYFGESGDHLHLIEIHSPSASKFDVFEIEKDYSGWFVKYRVYLDAFVGTFPEMIENKHLPVVWFNCSLTLLSVLQGERNEDSYLVLYIPDKVIRYNFVDKTFMVLFDFATTPLRSKACGVSRCRRLSSDGWLNAFPYIESLSPL